MASLQKAQRNAARKVALFVYSIRPTQKVSCHEGSYEDHKVGSSDGCGKEMALD
jgi:hypothetical protein